MSVGTPTARILRDAPVARSKASKAPLGSTPKPPAAADMNATVFFPRGVTLSAVLTVARLYQTGVPCVSRIIANEAVLCVPRSDVRYQPGDGVPAAGCGITAIGGKSCGRQRIQYSASSPFAFVASTTAAWFSVRL